MTEQTEQVHAATGESAGSMLPPTPQAPPAAYPTPAPTTTGVPTVAGAPLSSAGKRLGAYLLDAVLCMVTLVIGWFIWSLVVWSKGQTPAKALLGMRCVRADSGRSATWGTMFVREIVGKGIIGSITFGITTLVSCFMLLGADRQGIWDKVANTVVVDDPEGRLLHRV